MSDIIVFKDEYLIIAVDEPERDSKHKGILLSAWSGIIESKSQDFNMSQIIELMGKPEYVTRVMKMKNGQVTDITEAVMEASEAYYAEDLA